MLRNSIGFNGILLGIFALVTAAIVAVVFRSTEDKIADSKMKAAQAMLFEILPRNTHSNDLFTDTLPVPEDIQNLLGNIDSLQQPANIHLARRDNSIVAAIFPAVAPNGYSGNIAMLVGINSDHTIAGVRVIDHKETPGLGDGVEVRKGTWILSFNGKSLSDDLYATTVEKNGVVQRFDQLTGATITRKAVTEQVRRTLQAFEKMSPLDENLSRAQPNAAIRTSADQSLATQIVLTKEETVNE